MVAKSPAETIRPIHTVKFCVMLLTLFVLAGVLMCVVARKSTPYVCFLMWVPGLIGLVRQLIGIRSGKISVPKLNPQDSAKSDIEYDFIRKSLRFSIIVTIAATVVIAVLAYVHRINGLSTIVTVATFNLYGWVTYSWWQEAWQMVMDYKAERNALQIAESQSRGSSTEEQTYTVAATGNQGQPLVLHAGRGAQP